MNDTKIIIFRFLDICCIVVALAFSSWLMLPPYLEIFSDYTGASTFTIGSIFLSFYMLDCYSVGREDFKDTTIRLLIAVCIGGMAAGFAFYTFEHWRFPRMMFVIQMAVNLVLSLGWRWIYFKYSKNHPGKVERIIFLGAAMAGRARRVIEEHSPGTQFLGYVGEEGAHADETGPWLGSAENLFVAIDKYKATQVLILDSFYLDADIARTLFEEKLRGLHVEDMRGLYERLASRLPLDLIEDEWLILEGGFLLHSQGVMRRLKQAADICVAALALLVLSPVLLLTALCIRLESRGPVVYTQKRVGLGGREFVVYKLRSMCIDAEKDGAVWAQKQDPRVTKVGRFIRKTRIDELPQLLNVLKGDMSIVGPRPERMQFVKELEAVLPYYAARHSVKPGITGWAQVSYPYGASLEDSRQKLEYDLYYIKNTSPILEVKIVLKTIGVLLFPKGAR